MAFTTFLMTVSMVAIASAGFPGWPPNNNPFPGFPSPMMTQLRFGSPPAMPVLPTFQTNFPFLTLPSFPPMPMPRPPSVADIINAKPKDGGTFTGVMISSNLESKKNPNGTIDKKGSTMIVSNVDGKISMQTIGDPDTQTNAPPFDFNAPKIKPSNKNQFKNFNNFKKFDDINFDFGYTFDAIDPKMIETHKPGEGETFKGQSVRTHTFSSNNNGQVSEGGSVTRIDNDNGKVNKEKVVYHSGGTQP